MVENKKELNNYKKVFNIVDVLGFQGVISEQECKTIEGLVKELQDKVDKFENLDFTKEELQDLIGKLSNKVLIPNWFFKEHVEYFLGKPEISDDLYKLFISDVNDRGLSSETSDLLNEWLLDVYSEYEKEGYFNDTKTQND